ncbi:TetR/AcrR family transcriptional regulator [Cellulomonas bogoriensis]|uniref:TetR family transcriptional regulator n=1 Tax=Cellulomonas bogoriensis 69B4 = DSM 16987 TaxID=1386082 RepID=A0A0A0BP11_9CELL|nr:TetR/AcrR family transcriptional regulator [Cellulomonas bogoriensis]KGM08804.1 TetR family transcriptional regulator [Cellulomonas bogoriensis 69B4 = DSM 16987]
MSEVPGLRERKKTAAMLRIQAAALDLFEEHGFTAVTVEQVAAASDVSPSSVYRYFGTKEQLVLWDEFDPQMDHLLGPALDVPVPLDGLRALFREVLEGMGPDAERQVARRIRIAMSDPALVAATAMHTYAITEVFGTYMAERLGRSHDDLEIQVFSHSLVGGLLGAIHHWHGTGFAEPFADVLDRTFVIFTEGLDVVEGRPAD